MNFTHFRLIAKTLLAACCSSFLQTGPRRLGSPTATAGPKTGIPRTSLKIRVSFLDHQIARSTTCVTEHTVVLVPHTVQDISAQECWSPLRKTKTFLSDQKPALSSAFFLHSTHSMHVRHHFRVPTDSTRTVPIYELRTKSRLWGIDHYLEFSQECFRFWKLRVSIIDLKNEWIYA